MSHKLRAKCIHPEATCVELEDNVYDCSCSVGLGWNGSTCIDIDECITGHHNCANVANCFNTYRSFTCKCRRGFTGSGTECTNVNECIDNTHRCHQNATCIDTIGSFQCHCENGFFGDGFECVGGARSTISMSIICKSQISFDLPYTVSQTMLS